MMDEQEIDRLTFLRETVAARVRRRLRIAGVFMIASLALPVEWLGRTPIFIHRFLEEVHPAAALALLAIPIAGIAFVGLSFVRKKLPWIATFALATVLALSVVRALGVERARWDVLMLPDGVTNKSAWVLGSLALTSAGATLSFLRDFERRARFVHLAAFGAAVVGLTLPGQGEPLMFAVSRLALAAIVEGNPMLRLGLATVLLVAVGPLVLSLIGLASVRSIASRIDPPLALTAVFGGPALLAFFAYRSILFGLGGVHVLSDLFAVGLIASMLALVSDAVVIVVSEPQHGTLLRPALVSSGILAALVFGQWVLARPPEKGVHWTPSGRSLSGDRVFGTLLPNWNRARNRWSHEANEASSAEERIVVTRAAKELVTAARELDPELGVAMKELVDESDELDVGGRKWFRLLSGVNEVSRRKSMPYYADPTFVLYERSEELRRVVSEHSYVVESVTPYRVGRRSYATLAVRQLGHRADTHGGRLGFSSDVQPFALVVLDEVDDFTEELDGLVREERCLPELVEVSGGAGLVACGKALAKVSRDGALHAAVLAGTERHELEHQIDGPALPIATVVGERLRGYHERDQDRVNRELSAYVAELTAEGEAPVVGLVHLTRFVLGATRGSTHRVGMLAIEALAEERLEQQIDADHALAKLFAMPSPVLRARAQKAYRFLFGTDLPDPKRT